VAERVEATAVPGERVRTTANLGAYLSTRTCIPTILYCDAARGSTRPADLLRVTRFHEHGAVDAYRGAGAGGNVCRRAAGRDCGTRDEDRRGGAAPQELIRQFPYQTRWRCATTRNYEATLDAAMKIADVAGSRTARAVATARQLRGWGTRATSRRAHRTVEVAAAWRTRRLVRSRRGPGASDRTVTVHRLACAGQGTRRPSRRWCDGWADIEQVEIVHGDTSKILFGMALRLALHRGRRTAIVKALDKVVAKGKKIAAHLLEASEATSSTTKASSRSRHGQEETSRGAFAAYVPHNYPSTSSTGLNENASTIRRTSPSAGSYVCEVESIATRQHADRLVHRGRRFRKLINPMIVEASARRPHAGIGQRSRGCLRRNRPARHRSLTDYCIRGERCADVRSTPRDALHAHPLA